MHRRSTLVLLISGIAVALVLAAGYAWQSRGGGEAGEPNLLDAVNAKLQQQGEPTISPENDTGSGRRVDPTVEAIADATLAALPTPDQTLPCGPQADRNGPITSAYGQVRNRCWLVGTSWVVATLGAKPKPGIVAVFRCASDDTSCLTGGEPKGGEWIILDPPVPGGVTLLTIDPTNTLILDSGGAELCLNVDTVTWDAACAAPKTALAERAAQRATPIATAPPIDRPQ